MGHTAEKLKRTALYVLIFGLIAHAFVYFNLVYSHDSVIVYVNDAAWQVSIGRYLQPVYELVRGKLAVPWLIGLIALCYIALSAFLICDLLDIRKNLAVASVCGVLATNAAFSVSQATYLYLADVFMLAMLLCMLGVYLLQKYRFGFLPAALLFSVSLALYQGYLAAAVGLLLLLGIKLLLEQKPAKEIASFACRAVAALLLSGLVYWLGMKLALSVTGVSAASSYNSFAAAGEASVSLLSRVLAAYKTFFKFFLKRTAYNTVPLIFAGGALFVCACAALLRMLRQKRLPAASVLLIFVAFLLLPFGLTVTVFFSKGLSHEVMLYPLCLVYVAAIWLIERALREDAPAPERKARGMALLRGVAVAAAGLLLFCNMVFSNQAYLKKKLEYDAQLATVSRLVDRMENTEGYVPGETPVAIAGRLIDSYGYNFPGFEDYYDVAGLMYSMPLTFYGAYDAYFEDVMGRPLNLLPEADCDAFAARPEVVDMPCFPSLACCQMIDGVLVVKLSDG